MAGTGKQVLNAKEPCLTNLKFLFLFSSLPIRRGKRLLQTMRIMVMMMIERKRNI